MGKKKLPFCISCLGKVDDSPSKENNKKDRTIVEGKDYYIEKGLYVFTEYYLKERGYCCKNQCRHCPYGYKKGA